MNRRILAIVGLLSALWLQNPVRGESPQHFKDWLVSLQPETADRQEHRTHHQNPLLLDAIGSADGQETRRLQFNGQAYTPPVVDAPGRRVGGATRSGVSCFQGRKFLTALIPVNRFGVTVSAFPTFFWYLPSTSAKAVTFSLEDESIEDEDEKKIYTTTFPVTGMPGVVSLSLPADIGMPPLEIGKHYRWSLSIVCDPQNTNPDITVIGTIQRVELNSTLANQLEKAPPEARPAIYAEAGIWYDTLTTLAEVRRARPNDATLSADWENLLNSVALNDIAREPLVPDPETQTPEIRR